MLWRQFHILLFLICCSGIGIFAQNTATTKVYGKITDTSGIPLELVNITVKGNPSQGTTTNEAGRFELKIETKKHTTLLITSLGYSSKEILVYAESEKRIQLSIVLNPTEIMLPSISIKESYSPNTGVERINPKHVAHLPTLNSSIESLIKTAGLGVISNNELSSQYNVRGGNYDENLIYLNGSEVYRPFLIRSGQQEGLSFINPDLVSSVNFSSGGFNAQYGDKMSSVLDVKYKTPIGFGGSVYGSLLGAGGHIEGASKNQQFSYLLGVRYQSNAYIIKKMQTQGVSKPSATDAQLLLNYKPNEKWKFSLFSNFALNKYLLVPSIRETTFGPINHVKRLRVYFDGQEVDAYQTVFTSFISTYTMDENNDFQFIVSYFNSIEKETFDIEGQYFLSDVNTDFGSDELGSDLSSKAVGSDLHHGRNFLQANLIHGEIKGSHKLNHDLITWGLKTQGELIKDELNEWRLHDSAFYTLPFIPHKPGDSVPLNSDIRTLNINDYLYAKNHLQSVRFSGFVQDKRTFEDSTYLVTLTGGVRFSYWSFNQEFIITPRIRLTYQPKIKTNISFYVAGGMYFQPPFYKEMRDLNGNLNKDIKSQKSYHAIVGYDYMFRIVGRPFKLSSEIYYKYLNDLITYSIDNVRIIYSGKNDAKGYAVGIDAKLSGEIVPGLESWLSFSIMNSKEDIIGDFYYLYLDSARKITFEPENIVYDSIVYPGYIPRLTDQRFSINLFFQDKVPRIPMLKAHINLIYSTPLVYSPPGYSRALYAFRSAKPYFRADLGFSWQFINNASITNPKNPFRVFNAAYLTLEVFNIFNHYNIISYSYVKDINGETYRIPNYLTPRLFNAKLRFEF
ncbi:MAG: TonB-dependent receptor [Bacteroidales bacterium]|nr:TonB-dependent receptor [Bacteroidales bacterium]